MGLLKTAVDILITYLPMRAAVLLKRPNTGLALAGGGEGEGEGGGSRRDHQREDDASHASFCFRATAGRSADGVKEFLLQG